MFCHKYLVNTIFVKYFVNTVFGAHILSISRHKYVAETFSSILKTYFDQEKVQIRSATTLYLCCKGKIFAYMGLALVGSSGVVVGGREVVK